MIRRGPIRFVDPPSTSWGLGAAYPRLQHLRTTFGVWWLMNPQIEFAHAREGYLRASGGGKEDGARVYALLGPVEELAGGGQDTAGRTIYSASTVRVGLVDKAAYEQLFGLQGLVADTGATISVAAFTVARDNSLDPRVNMRDGRVLWLIRKLADQRIDELYAIDQALRR